MDLEKFSFQELNERLIFAIRTQNYRSSARYLKAVLENVPSHPSIFYQIVQSTITFCDMSEAQVNQLFAEYEKQFPNDPYAYLQQYSAFHNEGKIDELRTLWKKIIENSDRCFHYQPPISATVFGSDPDQTLLSSVEDEQIVENARNNILALSSRVTEQKTPRPENHATSFEPSVKITSVEKLDKGCVSLNGELLGFNEPTTYYFVYGNSKKTLNHQTQCRPIPAGVSAKTKDSGDNIFKRILAFSSKVTFKSPPEGASAFATMDLNWPFGRDRNHIEGIGVIDLALTWQTAAHDKPPTIIDGQPKRFPSKSYIGEDLDLRDATFTITYRSDDLNLKNFMPVVWIHGRTGSAHTPDRDNDFSAWAVTGEMSNQELSADGQWHKYTFKLPAHSDAWTYCASNLSEMGSDMKRYTYAPIQNLLRENRSGNIVLAFVGGDEFDTPEGDLEIAELELSYRSQSLLGPDQGCELIDQSNTFISNPALLTNGLLGSLEDCFLSDGPTQLTWKLRGTANISGFKLHQCAFAPTDECEISLSLDNNTYKTVWTGNLLDLPEDPAMWGNISRDPNHYGMSQPVTLEEPHETQYIRLSLKSAHRGHIIGLDAFEVFGSDLSPIPNGDIFTCSELAEEIPENEKLFVQCIAKNASGTYESAVEEFNLTSFDMPEILAAKAVSRSEHNARLAFRTRACGENATLHIHAKDPNGDEVVTTKIDIGIHPIARDSVVRIEGLDPNIEYSVHCWIENKNDKSETTCLILTP